MRTDNMLKKLVDELAAQGYKRTFIRDQIAEYAGVTPRMVNMWLVGSNAPSVYSAQLVSEWVSKKLGRKVRIEEIWPAPRKTA